MRAKPPIIALREAALSIGDKTLFNETNISIADGDRICLVGRNGSGKSTLLKVLAGEREIDSGQRFVQPGSKIGYLPQDPVIPKEVSVRTYIGAELEKYELNAGYEYQIENMLVTLGLDGAQSIETLSGGETRRLAIARALISDPDILLLDEPTNHLDLPTIEWFENELSRYRGGLLLISHDRAFLRRLTNKTYWIDRTVVRRNSAGFAEFSSWSEKVMQDEETEFRLLNKKIAEETKWLREGLTARRKRNMGRVRNLQELNKKKIDRLRRQGNVEFTLKETERSGELVLEAKNIASLWSTLCPEGGDTIDVGGQKRHVVSYLRDFLFEEKQAISPVRTLSGGERNRLLLARLFSKEHNLVVLDEPTNDLDVETLELLEEVLSDYKGTIILVSHDRDFLDRVATSTIVLEGDGRAEEYPGGYSTYIQQSRVKKASTEKLQNVNKKKPIVRRKNNGAEKLTYKDQRELDALPNLISDLLAKELKIQGQLNDPDFYRADPKQFNLLSNELIEIQEKIQHSEQRWIDLEEQREALEINSSVEKN